MGGFVPFTISRRARNQGQRVPFTLAGRGSLLVTLNAPSFPATIYARLIEEDSTITCSVAHQAGSLIVPVPRPPWRATLPRGSASVAVPARVQGARNVLRNVAIDITETFLYHFCIVSINLG